MSDTVVTQSGFHLSFFLPVTVDLCSKAEVPTNHEEGTLWKTNRS